MALPSMEENQLHNIGERIKQTGMLRKEDKEILYNISQSLTSDEITKAIKILLRHDPVTRRMNELTRQYAHDAWSNMTLDEQDEFVQKRVELALSRRKQRLAEQQQIKEEKRAELEKLIQEVKGVGLSPMFTHYYEDMAEDFFQDEIENRLAATTCILLDENGTAISKGLALVSVLDNGSKLAGRLLALQRAQTAFIEQKDSLPVYRDEAVANIDVIFNELGDWLFKAVYRPEDLSYIELERVAKRQGIIQSE